MIRVQVCGVWGHQTLEDHSTKPGGTKKVVTLPRELMLPHHKTGPRACDARTWLKQPMPLPGGIDKHGNPEKAGPKRPTPGRAGRAAVRQELVRQYRHKKAGCHRKTCGRVWLPTRVDSSHRGRINLIKLPTNVTDVWAICTRRLSLWQPPLTMHTPVRVNLIQP